MNTSSEINELATALAAAQAEIKNPAKESINPHFKSRYTDLAGGLDCVRPVLAKHGLSIVQSTGMDGEMMLLTTRLLHKSGQWIESVYPVARFPAQHQQIGSALSYSRRYSLFALAGIAGSDDDDDGNDASKEKIAPVVKDIKSPSDLLAEGYARAEDGPEALKAWWQGLSAADRKAIGPDNLSDMKEYAASPTQEAAQ